MKKRYIFLLISFVRFVPILAMEDPQEIEKPFWQIYINTISNETNEVAQISNNGKYILSIPAGKTIKVKIPQALQKMGNEIWRTAVHDQKGLNIWFRPSMALYYLQLDWSFFQNELNGYLTAQLIKKVGDGYGLERVVAVLEDEIPIDETTKEVQIGLDILLNGNPDQELEGTTFDALPVLKNESSTTWNDT